MAKSPHRIEILLHTSAHFILVFLVIYLLIVLPLIWAVIVVEIWLLQFLVIRHCFLTIFAHWRGVMPGMSFWEYVPKLMGIKDYRGAGRKIDWGLKIVIAGILLFRLLENMTALHA